jgi:hypothetical protein
MTDLIDLNVLTNLFNKIRSERASHGSIFWLAELLLNFNFRGHARRWSNLTGFYFLTCVILI